MTYALGILDRLFVVYWRGQPDTAALDTILAEVQTRYTDLDTKLLYVTVIPRYLDAPDGFGRAALSRFGERATPFVESTHIILEGDGFRASIQRSVVTAMYFFRRNVSRVHIYSSIEEARGMLAVLSGLEPGLIGRAIEACGTLQV